MNHYLRCECGIDLPISEGAAGTVVQCTCGRPITVPSLAELKKEAGMPIASTALIIEDMLAHRELPTVMTCVCCNSTPDETVTVTAQCEKAWSNERNPIFAFFVIMIFFGMWGMLLSWLQKEKEYGNNLILHLPVRICHTCHQRLLQDSRVPPLAVVALMFVIAGVAIIVLWTVWGALLFVGAVFTLVIKAVLWKQQQSVFKNMLSKEPIYQQLLNDFPNATLLLHTES
jgi:hypothetical protein